jgi:3,4-dihydroxy 2-butanone 4-phosphate synthase
MRPTERTATDSAAWRAVRAFAEGDPVLIHDADDREAETDLVYPASTVGPDNLARLRNDAGGLICVALSASVATAFDLPFLVDVLDHPMVGDDDLSYDDRSAFSLTVNHRDTQTGIPDRDRALTISELGAAAGAPDEVAFPERFRCPGHVHLLRAAAGGLETRRGHTELSVALANTAGQSPAAVVCEMLDDDTGDALDRDDARRYADAESIPFVDGADLLHQFT